MGGYTLAPPAVRDSMVRGKPSNHTCLLAITRLNEDEFHYMDTEKLSGCVIEIGNYGKIRAPERRFPE